MSSGDLSTMILPGNARALPLPDKSVHCVVTSPPYFGLRNYGLEPEVWGGDPACEHEWGIDHVKLQSGGTGVASAKQVTNRGTQGAVQRHVERATCGICGAWRGTLGNEPTPELFVAHLVEVFREVRRVLRDDGTVWLNLGDSYVASPRGNKPGDYSTSSLTNPDRQDGLARSSKPARFNGMKQKDLIGIPWLAAFALRADGWYLRADIIWAKGISFCPTYAGSSMPESVTDRPSRTHEYLFLLSKSARYYYDVEAVKESAAGTTRKPRQDRFGGNKHGGETTKHSDGSTFVHTSQRNLRSVWTINPKPYPGAHFATFPPALVMPCIKAGTSEYGACRHCGQPYRRFIERGAPRVGQQLASGANADGGYRGEQGNPDYAAAGAQDPGATKASILAGMVEKKTLAWVTDCACPIGDPVPCVVLDPFAGSGTTPATAHQLGRIGVGVEANPEYILLALERLQSVGAI